ncbi:MAG TPA: hypothetical protein VFW16_03705 [Streptosporangiaceae bacterium]|nr:hypothetical protein [Streptosporangiaceae bacterium]
MQENVIISHRGARFEIGRGPGFYGIWPAGAAQWQPIEWWPETQEGWRAAWGRFTDVERRRAIREVLSPAGQPPGPGHFVAADQPIGQDQPLGPGQPVSPGQPPPANPLPAERTAGLSATTRRAGRPAIVAAALLAAGVAIGLAGLFPGYFGSTGLAGQAEQLVPHVIYLMAWAACATFIVVGGNRHRTGALLAAGVSAVTLGLYVADLGLGVSGADVGAGLVLSLIGWAACAAGSVLAVRFAATGSVARPRTLETWLTIALAAAAAVGTAIAFAPSWDSFTLRTAAGTSQTITAGNAFANPGMVIAGDVVVMVSLVAIVIAAAAWRPVRLGAVLLAGAIVPMAAQAISAVIQIGQATPSQQFGIPPAQAARLGLTISAGLTTAFWVYCAFVFAMILTAALMASAPAPPPPAPAVNRPGQPPITSPTPPMGPAAPAVG